MSRSIGPDTETAATTRPRGERTGALTSYLLQADTEGETGPRHVASGIWAERAERVVRNYDPCISCAAHFLRMVVNRR